MNKGTNVLKKWGYTNSHNQVGLEHGAKIKC